jgi:hypothetical protein
MSVTLKLPYVEGIRLRQQMATNVSRTVDGAVIGGKEWKFESKDVEREQHQRLEASPLPSSNNPLLSGQLE